MNNSQFRIIDNGWVNEFEAAGKLKADEMLIVSPFIKIRAVKRLARGKKNIRVLTRFSQHDFFEGVSDIDALIHLLEAGAEVRGIRNLHAKLYMFGNERAILTSANLTDAALTRNHELGFVTDDSSIVRSCRDYFERLWSLSGKQSSLSIAMLNKWKITISAAGSKKRSAAFGLHDFGADLGFMPDAPPVTVEPTISKHAFVKFFGTSSGRSERTTQIFDEIAGSESHWSLSYPKGKRPRQPETGDTMFIARMVHSPNDILIYGRAVAYKHQPGRDDASAADIKRRYWKDEWSHYIRVRDPEFISGKLEDGISLHQLMDELGAEVFSSTSENSKQGLGRNTDPKKSIWRKAHILLTDRAGNLLNARFNQSLALHGRIPISKLEQLYWPENPV